MCPLLWTSNSVSLSRMSYHTGFITTFASGGIYNVVNMVSPQSFTNIHFRGLPLMSDCISNSHCQANSLQGCCTLATVHFISSQDRFTQAQVNNTHCSLPLSCLLQVCRSFTAGVHTPTIVFVCSGEYGKR